jgi:hypothetical protein
MPRKNMAVTLAAAGRSERAEGWTRLGFLLHAAKSALSLADGVCRDFFAPEDSAAVGVEDLQERAFLAHFAARRGGAALVGLGGEADAFLSARPQAAGFRFRFGGDAPEAPAFRIGGLIFRVADLASTEKFSR